MKTLNTRISPTPNGELHIGHYLTALVNEYEAHSSGGQFILSFDDNQEIWNLRQTSSETSRIERETVRTLTKLGLEFDKITSDLSLLPEINRYKEALGASALLPMRPQVMVSHPLDWANHNVVMYPYLPYLTMEKVIVDFINGINLLIRGEDLMNEYCLYNYFCDYLRLPIPDHIYISRLKLHNGLEISKTGNFPSLQKMLNKGWTTYGIKDLLRESALINPNGKFEAKNIKADPRLPENVFL